MCCCSLLCSDGESRILARMGTGMLPVGAMPSVGVCVHLWWIQAPGQVSGALHCRKQTAGLAGSADVLHIWAGDRELRASCTA